MALICPIDGSELEQVIVHEWLPDRSLAWQCLVCGGALLEPGAQTAVIGGALPCEGDLSTMQFPRDGSPMVSLAVGRHTVFGDKQTGDVWFSAGMLGEVRQLVRDARGTKDERPDEPSPIRDLTARHGFTVGPTSGEVEYGGATVKVEHTERPVYRGSVHITMPFDGDVSATFGPLTAWAKFLRMFGGGLELPDARLLRLFAVKTSTGSALNKLLDAPGFSHVLVQLGQLGNMKLTLTPSTLHFELSHSSVAEAGIFEHLCRLFYDLYRGYAD